MRFLLILTLCFVCSTALAKKDDKTWSKCQKDSDCVMAKDKACDGLCYNKKYIKEAFAWEKNIIWECITPAPQGREPRCEEKRCLCAQKK